MFLRNQTAAAALFLVVASVSSLSYEATAPAISPTESRVAAYGRRSLDVAPPEILETTGGPEQTDRRAATASSEVFIQPPNKEAGNSASAFFIGVSNPAIYAGGTGKRIATVEFWDKLAYCETHADWENPGRYAGGLGIYLGTWVQWGGRDFASHPSAATRSEQIVVANRISTQGWLRPDGILQDPVWFSGWGALGCAGRPELVDIKDPRAYTSEHGRLSLRSPTP